MMTPYPTIPGDGGSQIDTTTVPTVSPLLTESLVNSGWIEFDSITIFAMVLSVLVCCLCGFGVFGLFKYNALRKEKHSEMIRYQSGIK